MKRQLLITETVLRDGHQSLISTRLKTSEMLPIIEKMDQAGYHALEVWGGATFDVCIRYLNEDPWERLREIKKRVKNTKLQMLLRGQNLVGYRHYGDDIVEKFIQKSIENGIDIVRMFDGLNDLRNLKKAAESVKKYGGHCQIAICYTISPIHTLEYYSELACEIEKMGADSIVIKDMGGILLPEEGYKLVKKIKSVTSLPLELHSHATTGVSEMLYLRAVEAGVDIIDTAISPFSGGASQPATESIYYALEGHSVETNLSIAHLKEIAEYFKGIRKNYVESGVLNHQSLFTEPAIIDCQLPGGMLSNLIYQLETQNALHKYEEVLKEIPKVRKEMGYPPLVTPLSQLVIAQSVFNIIFEERYKIVSNELKDLIKGFYGKTPAPMDKEIVNKIIGETEIFTGRPADLIKDEFEKLKIEIGEHAKSEEDVLSYAMFPQVFMQYVQNKIV